MYSSCDNGVAISGWWVIVSLLNLQSPSHSFVKANFNLRWRPQLAPLSHNHQSPSLLGEYINKAGGARKFLRAARSVCAGILFSLTNKWHGAMQFYWSPVRVGSLSRDCRMGGFTQRPWTPTKRRGPIAAEHRSPGPACVALKSSIGE
jgi:hypothetical protein